MKSAEELLSTYKSVHLNKINIQTHFVGIPGIIWSLMILMNMLQWPIQFSGMVINITIAMILIAIIILYYFKLHFKLAIGMSIFLLPALYSSYLISQHQYGLFIALIVFVASWILQFIGHHYEQAKPAFFDDIMQLLVGPFFLMAEIYFMLGLEKNLEKTITALAIQKRNELNNG